MEEWQNGRMEFWEYAEPDYLDYLAWLLPGCDYDTVTINSSLLLAYDRDNFPNEAPSLRKRTALGQR